MTQPTITTIIPAYRAAGTIGRALDSVLRQTCRPEEILVVDDGSPDNLAAAVRPYGERVTLIRKSNGGAASARNLGLDRARGELIAFLDADDYWEANKLERQLAVFARHPEIGLTCGRWFTQEPGAAPSAPPACTEADFDRVLAVTGTRAFLVATEMWTSTILVRRNVVGTNRFISGLEPAEDRDLWVRLVSAAPVYMSSAPLATYVQEPGSLCRTNVDRDYGNMMRVVRRHTGLLGKHGVRHWETETFRKWAARYLGGGQPGAALKPAWNRLRRQPWSPEGWWVLLKSSLLAGPALVRPGPTS
ncbi:MAG TPA: glycosyltransferase family A protein [Gemmataceae bacterium]|nr:glycosyltransferase family A protein [Gemmataceae bacterium]